MSILCAYGHIDTVKAILESNLCTSTIISATNALDESALMLAEINSHTDIFNTILIHKHSCLKNDTTSKHEEVSLTNNSYFAHNSSLQPLGATYSDVNMRPESKYV